MAFIGTSAAASAPYAHRQFRYRRSSGSSTSVCSRCRSTAASGAAASIDDLPAHALPIDLNRTLNDALGRLVDQLTGGASERMANDEDDLRTRIPPENSPCPCTSGAEYGRCCGRLHKPDSTTEPRMAVDLLRARYSAYACRLPRYIMTTTSSRNEDFSFDRKSWRNDILEFCDQYKFLGLDLLETRILGSETTLLMFRANLSSKGQLISFIERSKFVQEKGKWFYLSGKLVEIDEGPY